jgi:hypothetical protein
MIHSVHQTTYLYSVTAFHQSRQKSSLHSDSFLEHDSLRSSNHLSLFSHCVPSKSPRIHYVHPQHVWINIGSHFVPLILIWFVKHFNNSVTPFLHKVIENSLCSSSACLRFYLIDLPFCWDAVQVPSEIIE